MQKNDELDEGVIFRPMRAQRNESFIVSAQDPLEIGWLSWLLVRFTKNAGLHVQVHGDYFSSNAWVGRSLLRRVRRFFAYILIRKVSAVRVVSNRIAQSLERIGIPKDRITILPIRPELEVFLRTERSVRSVPPYVFLYVGRLAPEKNIMRILESFNELRKRRDTVELRIIGDGDDRAKIISYIQAHKIENCVTLLPWTEHVEKEMARADVFLLASKHEAYALTLVESLAVGTPVITTDVGCVGEVVIDSVHGIVVTKSGVTPYVEAMKKMIDDTEFRESCGREGRVCAQKLIQAQTPLEYAQAWVTSVHHGIENGIIR